MIAGSPEPDRESPGTGGAASRTFACTYRLMLGPGFGFARARALVPYLRDLGVSHLYLPPSFQARAGSTHGYDVIDPTRVSDELGGEAELRRLARAAHAAGIGIVLDVVPNHMAADPANRYWADARTRARFFDVDPATGRHRRFFDVDELAGVRQEDPEVFEQTHRLALSLVAEGVVDGLRIDHPDGLADPAGYLGRLRERGVEHVWVEKILHPDEPLRDWPVDGTVGYEFLNDAAALFVDPGGQERLDSLWHELAADDRDFAEHASQAKLEQAQGTFAPEIERLAREADGARYADAEALQRAVAALPVYRTYVVPATGQVDEQDRAAVAVAGLETSLANALTLDGPVAPGFVTRFQQTTPAITAKGVEDTAFYRYARLLALNDVGGDPGRFGISVAAFHAANAERLRRFPRNLLATQTHDTKRSGDVRARIGALPGMADEWARIVRGWIGTNAPLRTGPAPDAVEEYFIYQTLVGAWPIELERLLDYMRKALREAKRNTAWVDGDEAWERGVADFLTRLYEHRPFLDSFEPFARQVAAAGERSALGQLLLKLTAPGVPDIYQGDELVSLSLVDPDNRRPVDFERRQELLDAVRAGAIPDDPDARKLALIVAALQLRARRPEAFAGAYEPLDAGERAVAFVRGGRVLVAIDLFGEAADAPLRPAAGEWRDVRSGDRRPVDGPVALGELTCSHGLALLERG